MRAPVEFHHHGARRPTPIQPFRFFEISIGTRECALFVFWKCIPWSVPKRVESPVSTQPFRFRQNGSRSLFTDHGGVAFQEKRKSVSWILLRRRLRKAFIACASRRRAFRMGHISI